MGHGLDLNCSSGHPVRGFDYPLGHLAELGRGWASHHSYSRYGILKTKKLSRKIRRGKSQKSNPTLSSCVVTVRMQCFSSQRYKALLYLPFTFPVTVSREPCNAATACASAVALSNR